MTLNYTDALLTLAAADFETVVKFYCQLLAQEPKPYILNVYAEFQLSGLRLGVFKPKASSEAEFASVGGGMSLCLEVADLEYAIAFLSNLGYPPLGEITTASHGREIYAYDPMHNRLILHQAHK